MVLTREKFTTFIEKLCGEDYIIGMHGIDQYRLTDGKKSIAQQVEEMQRIIWASQQCKSDGTGRCRSP